MSSKKQNATNARKRIASKPTEADVRAKCYATVLALDSWPNYQDEEYADRVLRARYYRDVKSYAAEHLRLVKEEPYETEDEAREALEQTIDGCSLVIYTARARCVLAVSDNASEGLSELEELGGPFKVETAAYFTLLRDVQEEIERMAEEVLGVELDAWWRGERAEGGDT